MTPAPVNDPNFSFHRRENITTKEKSQEKCGKTELNIIKPTRSQKNARGGNGGSFYGGLSVGEYQKSALLTFSLNKTVFLFCFCFLFCCCCLLKRLKIKLQNNDDAISLLQLTLTFCG